MLTPSNITKGHRVLVGIPHANRKNQHIDDLIVRVKSFTYPYFDVLIVDNSDDTKHYKKLQQHGINVIHIKPNNKSTFQLLAESHEAIRQYALKFDYSYLLHLEDDVFPPVNVIERLMIHNLPIVSAMYMINFGAASHLMAQDMENFGTIHETLNYKDGADLMLVDGTLKAVYACGLGCILIHRNVLKQFQFRFEPNAKRHPDAFFNGDMDGLGIQRYLDTSVLCEHKNSPWLEM